MFAGGPAIEDSANTSPQLIRFAVKANHVEYRYVAENQYFLPNNVQQPAERLYREPAGCTDTAFHQLYAGHGRDQERLAAAQCLR
jgi:hypothetical protein